MEPEIAHYLPVQGVAQFEEERMHCPVPNQQKHDQAFLRETVTRDLDSHGNCYEED